MYYTKIAVKKIGAKKAIISLFSLEDQKFGPFEAFGLDGQEGEYESFEGVLDEIKDRYPEAEVMLLKGNKLVAC